jgi:hypothetical protein
MLVNHSTNIQNILEETKELLSQTPPHGKDHLTMIKRLLIEREPMWNEWKHKKFIPPMEDIGIPNKVTKKTNQQESYNVPKMKNGVSPHLGHTKSSAMKDYYANAIQSYSFSIDINRDLPSLSMGLKENSPPLDDHFKDYVVALDPEEGIDEEYHPKNDHVWTWRAMRLLRNKSFHYWGENLVRKTNGDFEGLIRVIYKNEKGVIIPGEDVFLQNCHLESNSLSDGMEDDHEELSQDAQKFTSTKIHSGHSSPGRAKDAESFSSGEIDEDEVNLTVGMMDDVQTQSSVIIHNAADESNDIQKETIPVAITLSPPNDHDRVEQVVIDMMAPKTESILGFATQYEVDDNVFREEVDKIDSSLSEDALNGLNDISKTDAESHVNKSAQDTTRVDKKNEPPALVGAIVGESFADCSLTSQPMVVCADSVSNEIEYQSRKRKLVLDEMDVSLDRPSKKMIPDVNARALSQNHMKHSDRPGNMDRQGNHQSQSRGDLRPRSSLHMHPPYTRNNNGDNYFRPEPQQQSTQNNNPRPTANVRFSQPSQPSRSSYSTSDPVNRRDGNHAYGSEAASQLSARSSNRRYDNRRDDRRTGSYNRSR